MARVEHAFELTGVDTDSPREQLVAICTCHNPDGEGVGRMDFRADGVDELVELWLEHYIAVEVQPIVAAVNEAHAALTSDGGWWHRAAETLAVLQKIRETFA